MTTNEYLDLWIKVNLKHCIISEWQLAKYVSAAQNYHVAKPAERKAMIQCLIQNKQDNEG